MKKTAYLLCAFLVLTTAFAQESTSFKIQKNQEVLMDLLRVFPHELHVVDPAAGFMYDNTVGTNYSLINPNQDDRPLDEYAVLKSDNDDVYVVRATWGIEITRYTKDTSRITIQLEYGIDSDNKELDRKQIKSTGVFERELLAFLNSDQLIIKEIYDVRDDSIAAPNLGDDYVQDDYSMSETPIKETSENLSLLIKNGKIIPFPLSADYFSKKLELVPVKHDFEAAVEETYYSWNLDESIGLLYYKGKDGLEYYSFYTLNGNIITGLPFNLEMNYSTLEGCLADFKGYLPQWTQVVEENGDTYFQINFKTKECYVHLEFYSESKNLKTVLISNKERD